MLNKVAILHITPKSNMRVFIIIIPIKHTKKNQKSMKFVILKDLQIEKSIKSRFKVSKKYRNGIFAKQTIIKKFSSTFIKLTSKRKSGIAVLVVKISLL